MQINHDLSDMTKVAVYESYLCIGEIIILPDSMNIRNDLLIQLSRCGSTLFMKRAISIRENDNKIFSKSELNNRTSFSGANSCNAPLNLISLWQ